MKYILALLILTSAAFADISHSFTIPIQTDGYGAKTNVATWAGARGGASSNVSSPSGDTLAVYSWCSDLATDTFKVGRAYLWSDTINSASYIDSINDIAAGNSVRFDSLEIPLTGIRFVDNGGCSGWFYLYAHDSCIVNANNYSAGKTYGLLDFNDIWSPALTTSWVLVDSVQGSAIGTGPTVVTFTIKDRTILDEIECIIALGGSTISLGFCIVSCYDQSNTQPAPSADYNSKVSFYALENAGADPYGKMYWTEVEPALSSGARGSWRNAMNSAWRNTWRR